MDGLKILNTAELLELLRNQQEIKGLPTTNYRLSKILGINHNSVVNLLKKGGIMSDETAFRLADELELPYSYVLLCMTYERAKSEEARLAIQEIADKYLKAGAFMFFLSSLVSPFVSVALSRLA